MLTIATNTNMSGASNDIHLDGKGNLATLHDANALANVICNALRVQMGELQYSKYEGIPYLSTIFSSQTNIDLFEASVVDRIQSFPEVNSVVGFEYKITDNTLTYTARISTIYGEAVING